MTGKPYELPFLESFTDNNLHYFWETENARLLTSEDASDGDGAAVEILAKQTGGVFFESGKINIKDITNPAIIFDAKGTGVRALTVYVSKDGGDYQILQTAQLSGTYNTFQMPLTEVQDAEQFIRFKFKGMYMTPSEVNVSGNLVSKGNYVTLDAIRILDLYEHDLEVSMEAPASIVAGNTAKVKMTIKNNAENAATGFTLKLTAGNKVILDKTYEEDLDGFATLKAEADFATTVFDEAGAIVRYDPESGQETALARQPDGSLCWTLAAGGSLALRILPDRVPAMPNEFMYAEDPFAELKEGWTVRRVVRHAPGKNDFEIVPVDEKPRPIMLGDWRATLGDDFSGKAVYRTTYVSATARYAETRRSEVVRVGAAERSGSRL